MVFQLLWRFIWHKRMIGVRIEAAHELRVLIVIGAAGEHRGLSGHSHQGKTRIGYMLRIIDPSEKLLRLIESKQRLLVDALIGAAALRTAVALGALSPALRLIGAAFLV